MTPATRDPRVRTILTVDDSPSLRRMIGFTLKGAGYRVIEASDGREALDKARANPISLVLTDQHMPNMDGLALIRALRAMPQYAQLPIVMLTTESGDAMKIECRAAGATGWMVKPFDPRRLLDVVDEVTR
jgi:two-component system chemotaxis response regulator CheY